MPDVTLPTPGEVEEMRERHGDYGDGRCVSGEYWPCDAARLLALVDTLHEDVREHWCIPACPDGCDITETRTLTTDPVVTRRRRALTDVELDDIREWLASRRSATGEGA